MDTVYIRYYLLLSVHTAFLEVGTAQCVRHWAVVVYNVQKGLQYRGWPCVLVFCVVLCCVFLCVFMFVHRESLNFWVKTTFVGTECLTDERWPWASKVALGIVRSADCQTERWFLDKSGIFLKGPNHDSCVTNCRKTPPRSAFGPCHPRLVIA
jgi:hypothetical protein